MHIYDVLILPSAIDNLPVFNCSHDISMRGQVAAGRGIITAETTATMRVYYDRESISEPPILP